MIGTGELVIIFLAILLLFGGKKLPELAKSLGQAIREFRSASSIEPQPPSTEFKQLHEEQSKRDSPE